MTTLGMRLASPPQSPHANLVALERIGTNKQGSAVWRLVCECGKAIEADAFAIKRGRAHCTDCNPRYGDRLAAKILAVLPATIDEIVAKTGMTLQQVKFRLRQMKPVLCHTGRWKRSTSSFLPVICSGPGEDVPCTLQARTVAENNRRYRKRVKKEIAAALAGTKRPVRYRRLVARREAEEIAARTRVTPQTWMSALMQ